ncbi:MAG: cell division protein ZapA [Firmicutes bacterium]|nr:cell division protein ZapA [Bacillota bacterium]
METKVKVRIYGQDYTIAGDRDEETIRDIAAYVDGKMKEIGRNFTSMSAQGSLAVLAAVNVADEYFQAQEQIQSLSEAKEQLEKDAQHYLKMWDEAKKSFLQYKESAAKNSEEKKEAEERYQKLQDKCSEFENSFFDLQMENIKLKNELDKYRRRDE